MFSMVQSVLAYFDLHMKISASFFRAPHTRSARNPSARAALLMYRIRQFGVIISSRLLSTFTFPYFENLKKSSFHQFAAVSCVSVKIIISVIFPPFKIVLIAVLAAVCYTK